MNLWVSGRVVFGAQSFILKNYRMLCTAATSDLLSSYFWQPVAHLVSCQVQWAVVVTSELESIAATAARFLMLCYKNFFFFDCVCMFNLFQTNNLGHCAKLGRGILLELPYKTWETKMIKFCLLPTSQEDVQGNWEGNVTVAWTWVD